MATKKRLIDAIEQEMPYCPDTDYEIGYQNGLTMAKAIILKLDAVEVVHGKWEDFCRGKMCCCSACKAEFDNTCNEIHGEWKFCPECGAKMDGDGNGTA